LAKKIGLDFEDYEEWAHTADEKPIPCKAYRIPNTVYFHHGKEKFWDLKYSIVYTLYEMDKARAAKLEKDGEFKVISKSVVSDSEIKTALRDDYVYQYNFSGHGQPDGINTCKSNGVLAQRYTKYGINRLQLNCCYSALRGKLAPAFYTYNEWEWNVAKRGMVYGFSGGVSMLNVFDQLRATHGKNRKGMLE